MIDKISLSGEWLNSKQAEYKKDPSLIESMIHALYLYLACHTLVQAEGELKKFDGAVDIKTYLIEHPDFNFLNKKLKFVAKGEALFYWSETIKLIR